jgi:hypothetical protein
MEKTRCATDAHCVYHNAAKNNFAFFCVKKTCTAPKKSEDFCSEYSACPLPLTCKNGRCTNGDYSCSRFEYYDKHTRTCVDRRPLGSDCPDSFEGSEEPCLEGICYQRKCVASCLYENPEYDCYIPFTKCTVIEDQKRTDASESAKNSLGACQEDANAKFRFRIGGGGGGMGGGTLRRYDPRAKPVSLTVEAPPEPIEVPDRTSFERTRTQGIIFLSVGGALLLLLAILLAFLKFSLKKKQKNYKKYAGPNDSSSSNAKAEGGKSTFENKKDQSGEAGSSKNHHLDAGLLRKPSATDRLKAA